MVEILTSGGATAAWYEYDAWGNVVSIGGNASIAKNSGAEKKMGGKNREKKMKKFEKISMQNRIYRLQ